jgi:hypothetical protein
MMKTILSLLLCVPAFLMGQTFTIKSDIIPEISTDNVTNAVSFSQEIKKFSIKIDVATNPVKTYQVQVGSETKPFLTDGNAHEVQFAGDVRDQFITVHNENDAVLKTFSLKKPAVAPVDGQPLANNVNVVLPKQTAESFIVNTLFRGVRIRDVEGVGLRLEGNTSNSRFEGPSYIHLFFDQNGNSLIRSIPIGIGKANYVVHVVYLVPSDNPRTIDYKINQSTADIDEGVVIRGDGDLDNLIIGQSGPGAPTTITYEWQHEEQLLTGSSVDILFDIVRNTYTLAAPGLAQAQVVATRRIKMKRIYHGSLEVGLLESHLNNPTYTLVSSDVDDAQKVVKKSDDHRRTFASAMYTFYVSPIVLLQKLFNPKKVRNYRLEGRNFVDDHKIYERIYPTFGIGLNDRLLDNYFIGGKWEFVRGGALFVGYHRGKINVLDVDEDFKFAETFMTQETFDLKKGTDWRGAFCIGLNLDVRIITNLFGRASAASE